MSGLHEVSGDIWDFPCDVRVIPTNGYVRRYAKSAVMGAGLAKQAAHRYPNLPEVLGKCILAKGHHVHGIRHDIVAFPVKINWWEPARLDLIEQSAQELLVLVNKMPDWHVVALPRVGCGNGGLRWEHVKPVLDAVFGDDARFVVVRFVL